MESTRSRGDRYALSALRNKRAAIASSTEQKKVRLLARNQWMIEIDINDTAGLWDMMIG